jgi:hypothetical protein
VWAYQRGHDDPKRVCCADDADAPLPLLHIPLVIPAPCVVLRPAANPPDVVERIDVRESATETLETDERQHEVDAQETVEGLEDEDEEEAALDDSGHGKEPHREGREADEM